MADEDNREQLEEGAGSSTEDPAAATDRVPPRRRTRGAAPWLTVLLILVIGGVASSPFWAPEMIPLFPWGSQSDTAGEKEAALAARVAALEQRPAPPATDIDIAKSAQNALAHRVDQLESAFNARLTEFEKRPTTSASDNSAMKAAVDALAGHVDQLEAKTSAAERRVDNAVAAEKEGLQPIEQRLAKLEAQSASLKTDDAAAAQNMKAELSRLSASGADLANRLSSLEGAVKSRSGERLRTDAMLVLLVAQMREAVDQARPFPAEYDTFTKLVQGPQLVEAGKALSKAARDGAASRAVLAERLAELARAPVIPSQPVAESDWGTQALARLRGLVTVRRIDGAAQTGPEKALGTAQTALARGDLSEAVATLGSFTGAEAETVRPWLQMARERLAVETALDHIQGLLTMRLGNPSAEPSPAPPSTPQEPPQNPRPPS